jgi:hypothetical protein
MAGRGPAPKGKRARDRDTPEFEHLADDGELHGAPLPDGVLPDGEPWHPQTLALWDSLRRSPLLANEPELGWQFLVDTALMHHTMWTKGKWEFASEVRLRVAKFGATPEDRMRLKVKIETPLDRRPASESAKSTVTDIRSRRSRLTEDAS